jgi:hypothetical protein
MWMLRWLDGTPSTYAAWARDYYERDLPLTAVRAIYSHHAITAEILKALNSELSISDISADRVEIGYP